MSFDPRYLLDLPPRETRQRYTERDAILYALGVGAGHSLSYQDLRFVFEDGLLTLPTMAVVLGYPGFWQSEPHYGIDWRRVLHAEQSCIFHQRLPPSGEVRSVMTIDAVVDKGRDKGSLLRVTRRIYDAGKNALLVTVRQTSFLRGDGGAGSGGAALPAPHCPPPRTADALLVETTRPNQALLYRLSGDYNPLHADPAAAAAAGFKAPMLHGLCTYGIVGRAILGWACENDPDRLARLDGRFTAPVYPGDTLEIDVWKDEDVISFTVRVPARGQVVLNHGHALIKCSS